mmetsp:Transcript_45789/g.151834  ORF Transcript_45789/g.151834 Transcript_45789/m.151834 type:complete len:212 (+) Transcript_45789:235-870(+)
MRRVLALCVPDGQVGQRQVFWARGLCVCQPSWASARVHFREGAQAVSVHRRVYRGQPRLGAARLRWFHCVRQRRPHRKPRDGGVPGGEGACVPSRRVAPGRAARRRKVEAVAAAAAAAGRAPRRGGRIGTLEGGGDVWCSHAAVGTARRRPRWRRRRSRRIARSAGASRPGTRPERGNCRSRRRARGVHGGAARARRHTQCRGACRGAARV